MRGFNIDQWFIELPGRLSSFFHSAISQPVTLAIFCIIIFFIWRKFRLGSKLYLLLHKVFKFVRVSLVIVIIIAIASFIQYRQNSADKKEQIAGNHTDKQVISETKPENTHKISITEEEKEFVDEEEILTPIDSDSNNISLDVLELSKFLFFAAEEKPINSKVLLTYQKANTLFEEKKYRQAINEFSKIMKYFTSPSFLYSYRGASYFYIKNYKEALFDFDYAIQINPGAPELYNNRGLVLAKQENFEAAIKDFNIAIFLDSDMPDLYINRGCVYYLDDKYHLALSDWKKALLLDKTNIFLNDWINKALGQK